MARINKFDVHQFKQILNLSDVPHIDLEAMKEAQLQAVETPDSSEPGEPTSDSKEIENMEEMDSIQEENDKEAELDDHDDAEDEGAALDESDSNVA